MQPRAMHERREKVSSRHNHERLHGHHVQIIPERKPNRIAFEQQPLEIEKACPSPRCKTVPVVERPTQRHQGRPDHHREQQGKAWSDELRLNTEMVAGGRREVICSAATTTFYFPASAAPTTPCERRRA